jgi:hypothetical protein
VVVAVFVGYVSLANRVGGAIMLADAHDAFLMKPNVDEQPGLAVPVRDVDELVHGEHLLHMVARSGS